MFNVTVFPVLKSDRNLQMCKIKKNLLDFDHSYIQLDFIK